MNEKLLGFLKAIVKYGGADFIVLILLGYFFDEFFHINPATVDTILNYLLWIIFGRTIFVIIANSGFWIAEKVRDFNEGEDVVGDIGGVSTTDVAKDLAVDTLVALKNAVTKTPEEKEKAELEKLIKSLEKALEKSE